MRVDVETKMATLKKEKTQQEVKVTNTYNKFITRILNYQWMKAILKELNT